ncbi:MAG: hypothetical protein UV51_C0007G0008 [Candidatus Woesebacteria bacterium GW2011_GWC1_42_9]|nr:MAG: hypothetical protein UV51_C0007G0008 [Candidatus Woesebacteria bacterium GW2011_GWC1_42_9]
MMVFKTRFGFPIYYNPEMKGKETPMRVNLNDGRIEVNPDTFDSLSEAFQFFILNWAVFSQKIHDVYRLDELCLQEMFKKYGKTGDYRIQFLHEFSRLFNNGMEINTNRIKALTVELTK